MKAFVRILILAAAVTALSQLCAEPARAQSNDVDALNKRIVELYTAEKYAEAIVLAKQVLEIREKALGPNHPEVALSLAKLADLYIVTGRYADAEPLYQRSLGILQKTYGSHHPSVQQAQQQLDQLKLAQAKRDSGAQVASMPPPPAPAATAPPPQVSAAPPASPSFTTRSARPTPPASAAPAPPSSTLSASTSPALPDFPWPPPTASASYVLPRNLLPDRATVGQVADTIVAALERTGYVERSYFRTQSDGVALVTRLEGINDDGTALAAGKRWPTLQDSKDLMSAVRGLFFVDRGLYRVIVFILQDKPFVQSPDSVSGEQARSWLRTGANMLPAEVANRPFSQGECSVLIYEFASDGTAVRRIDSRLTGREHLEKAGVLAYLGRAN
jgi:Tetratricopeptide repeat